MHLVHAKKPFICPREISLMSYRLSHTKPALPFRIPLLALMVVLGCATSPIGPRPEFSKALQIFGEEKSKAEQWASVLKSGKWTPQSKGYVEGVKLYIEAKASFDGLIARLRSDLSASDMEAQVVAASKKSSDFAHHVYTLQNPDANLVWSTAAQPLIDAGLEIWKAYQEAEKQTREDMRKELDRLTWIPFDKIGGKPGTNT